MGAGRLVGAQLRPRLLGDRFGEQLDGFVHRVPGLLRRRAAAEAAGRGDVDLSAGVLLDQCVDLPQLVDVDVLVDETGHEADIVGQCQLFQWLVPCLVTGSSTKVDEQRNPRTRSSVVELLDRYLETLDVGRNTKRAYTGYLRKHVRPLRSIREPSRS